MSSNNTPLPYEAVRYTIAIEKKFHEKIKQYSYKKRVSLAVQVRRWIKEGYLRDKEKDKMDI